MVIFPLAPDQTIAQMWSNGARGGPRPKPTLIAVNNSLIIGLKFHLFSGLTGNQSHRLLSSIDFCWLVRWLHSGAHMI